MEPVETARPHPEQQGQETAPKVELEVVTAAAINYAMAHSGVPVVAAIRIRNVGTSSLAGAVFEVRLEPDLGEAALFPVPLLKPGESWEPGPLDVPLPPGRLRAITEAENGVLRFSLGVGDSLLESGERPFRLLAFNEWPGSAAPLALVAVFVTPNQPAIAAVLRIAREALQRQTGDDSFSGYQSKSSKRVLEQVRAVYAAIQQLGISYVGVPASFEETGQKVRFAEQVMTDRMGNCLDLALLFASCLEQIGLAPLVVILKSHALPAVWLVDDTFPEGVVDDLARVRNQIELTNLLAFDATTAISGDRPALEQAVSAARSHLLEHETFRVAVDVRAVRKGKGGYRPLPIRAPVPGGGESADAEEAARAGSGALEGALDADLAAAGALAAAGRAAEEARASDPVTRRVRKWRERLLDLTLRNRLLNFRPGRGVIPLEIPDLAAFENSLAQDVDFEVLPQPVVEPTDQRSTKLVESHADPEQEKRRLLDEMEQRRLHASLQPEDLIAIGKKLSRQARVDLEEGGANTLFLVAGVLKWFESESSDQVRYAPLLLIPVRLEYEPRRSRIRLRRTDEDVAGNITLAEMLKADFGLDLAILNDLPVDDHGVDVPRVLRGVREAIQSVRRWEVLPEAYVGSFTFGKFLMWNDLGANEAALLANPIVRHIAEGGTKAFPDHVSVPDERRLDADVPAAEIPTIRDADSTQLAAIIAALRGRTFVLQGPPGTGKSQTITNLIAAAVALRKTVLFVSEKMAALEVVHRRLKEAGLDPFCLELHSNKSNKKQVLESLGRAFESRPPGGGDGFSKNAEAVDRLRAELNEYVRALHCERPIGMSFFRAWSKAARHPDGGAPLALDVPCDPDLDQARFQAAVRAAQQLQLPAEKIEPVARHPWRESAVAGWSAAVERAIRDSLNSLRPVLREAADQDAALQTLLGAAVPISLDGAEALAAAVALLADGRVPAATLSNDFGALAAQAIGQADMLAEDEAARSDLDSRWSRGVFDLGAELAVLRTLFERHASSNAIVRFFTLRKSRQRLAGFAKSARMSDPAIAADLEAIVRCRERALDVARAKSEIASVLEMAGEGAVPSGPAARSVLQRMRRVSEALAGLGPEHQKLVGSLATGNDAARREEAVRRAQAVLAATKTLRGALATTVGEMQAPRAFPESSAPGWFAELRETVDRLTASLPRFREWAQYVQACSEAAPHGLRPLIEAHRRGEVSAAGMPAQTERALLDPWVEHVRDAEPVLRNFDGAVHDRRILEFREADEAHLRHSRARVVAALDASRPTVLSTATESSEPGILIRQLKKKRGHLPIRALFQQIPNLLPRLKPCFLMSPLSVAQYLPPTGRVHFDLVVFDEASQIGTHDAIGVIARGAQAVIVGDSKQLPPTTFFERSFDSEEDAPDEADIADLESVLDEAIAARMPEQSLGWHYRSRHESLIRFSNHHYYSDQLHVFPAARGRVPDLGIKWHSVDGTYEFGSTRQNPREARALVDWLVRALRETPVGARTFGVVTFSQPQQTLVEDLLDEARRAHPEIEPHFSDELLEHVFVKNLENVQGDERDEILFSICYGPAEDRRVRMNFGPLNRAGGERRLNVAVTRARCLLRVFSSITHDQIDLTKTQATGARHLRDFLRYAREEDGSVPRAEVVSEEHDSDFERVVCDALRELGHAVDPQVGCGGYRIDLGVRHPKNAGIYVLGVECDGAAYHSGTTARDRDRLRQSVLKGLGWRLHRVWSTDWTFNRQGEIEKLKAAVEQAVADADRGAPAPARDESKPAAEAPPASGATTPEAGSSDSAGLEPVPPAGPPVGVYARPALRLVSRNQDDLFDPGFRPHLREALLKVVAAEGPVHEDVATKGVASAFSWKRLSERARTAVMDEVGRLRTEGEVVAVDGFLWLRGVDPGSWSKIRGADAGGAWRPIAQIAIEEIVAAACWHLEHGLSMQEKDLVQATARTFGFERVGQENGERIALAIDRAVALGRARRTEAGRIEWVRAP